MDGTHHPPAPPVSKPEMKLLVLAQTPPPVHGQSVMVQALVEGLPPLGIPVHHVNLGLSRDAADIGRWRMGKVFALGSAIGRAIAARFRHDCDTLYYVPAPGKRGALYRDWLVMLLCRPFFRRLVLHWHAAGLAEWLTQHGTGLERAVTRRLLGGADLAIVLGESLRPDALALHAKRIAVVRNGIVDPCPGFVRVPRSASAGLNVIFVGLCSREKGVFSAAQGILDANRRRASGQPLVCLTAAGDFADADCAHRFQEIAAQSAGAVRHAGFVSGERKEALFAQADALVFPTRYPYETQGLVVAEALAFDLPVITTRWRAVHEGLPTRHVHFVEADAPGQIADALDAIGAAAPPNGALRAHFLAHFTREQHLAELKRTLQSLG